MPVIKQHKIHQNDINDNERVTYVYYENEKEVGGDSLTKMLRRNKGLNTLPLIVKKRAGMESASWIADKDCDYHITLFNKNYDVIHQRLLNNCLVVFPTENMMSEEYSEDYFNKYSFEFTQHLWPKISYILREYLPKKFQ